MNISKNFFFLSYTKKALFKLKIYLKALLRMLNTLVFIQ